MSGHTPLPWRTDSKFSLRVAAGDNFTIASTGSDSAIRDAWEANAALIIAAVNDRPALLRRVAELEAALRPFADLGVGSGPDHQVDRYSIEYGAIRRASAALSTTARCTDSSDHGGSQHDR